jgi:hypothetical protein
MFLLLKQLVGLFFDILFAVHQLPLPADDVVDDDVELRGEAEVGFGGVHGIPIAIVGHDGCC